MAIADLFPTPIFIHDFEGADLKLIQDEITLSLPEIRKSQNHSTFTGSVNSTFKFDQEENVNDIKKFNLKVFNDVAISAIRAYSQMIDYRGPVLKIDGSWINFFNNGNFYHDHNHPGVKVAGVYYYATNGKDGDLKFQNPNPYMYSYQWPADGTPQDCMIFPPKVGRLMLWPAWMIHRVEQNQTDSERISIGINYN